VSSKKTKATEPPPRAFDGYGLEIAAALLLILAVVAGFGVYASSAGALGRGLATLLGWIVGVLRYIAPIAFVGAAVACAMRGRLSSDDPLAEAEEASGHGVRRAVGALLLFLCSAGLLHLALHDPKTSGMDSFTKAGGAIGAGMGGPLKSLITGAGAAAILVILAILGLSLILDRSLASLATSVGRGSQPVAAALGRWVGDLFRVGDDDLADETPLFDHEQEGNELPKRNRRRKAASDVGSDAAELAPVVVPAAPVPPAAPPEPTVVMAAAVEPTQLPLPIERTDTEWVLPPMDLLSHSAAHEIDTAAIRDRGHRLEATLAEHGVQTRLSGMTVGPTVTRYELELGIGVKVNSVINLQKDIAYAMATPEVRIEAPIRGKQAIGVEVPNLQRQLVLVGDILASPEAIRATNPLQVAVGRDIEGRNIVVDLAKMPHVLIAGQTGAGKSSCINTIMTSVLMRATPDEVRLILVDPKRVELTQYNRIPHLLTQVVTDPKKAANALNWAVKEMDRRYELLERVGVRDIGGYNAAFDRGELVPELGEEIEYPRLPYILVVVDELADLMIVAARDVEESINRIAAKARAVGIHLVIATQRPSVDVITGVIKANIPARFAFSVATATDSKVILGNGGAEKLIGGGDMLILGPGSSLPDRIQGCWADEPEVHKVVSHWRRQVKEVRYVEEVQGEENTLGETGGTGAGNEDDDDLLLHAMDLVVRSGQGSTSMLQRKLKVGFARAGRLMDLLEERGVVGPSVGSKAREVLMTVPELEAQQRPAGATTPPDPVAPAVPPATVAPSGFDDDTTVLPVAQPAAVTVPEHERRAESSADEPSELGSIGGFGVPLD
jgi:S-DNA-T family DNA segregation ATPase FtsK/SpoIIIE